MSGSTIGGVVGLVIGAYFGNPQLGWMIGSAVGGYVDPDVITGPRLSDARTQTSRDGVAIPFGWGTFPTAGNLIWVQPGEPTEHKNSDRGKGGPVQETFSYTRSYAIGICEGPITGILQIKRNGKIVYDARDESTLQTEFVASGNDVADFFRHLSWRRAENGKFLSRATIYLGDESQLPDPTMEEWLGVGEVSAHRGMAYMVVTDDDVTELQGAVPQYEFVVSVCGDLGALSGDEVPAWLALPSTGTGNTGLARLSHDVTAWPADQTFEVEENFEFASVHDRTILLTGFTSDRVAYSANRGANWVVNDLPIAMDAASGRSCWAGYWFISGGNGEYVLRGNGTTFTKPNTTSQAVVRDLCLANTGTGRIVAATIFGSPNNVSISDDFGVTWDWYPTASVGSLSTTLIDSDGGGRVVLAGYDGAQIALQYSNDDGETWALATSPFTDGGAPSAIRYSASANCYVVASNAGQVAYSGTGASWTLATTGLGSGVYVTGIDSNQSGRIACACSNGTIIYTDSIAGGFTGVIPASQPGSMHDVAFIDFIGDEIPDSPGFYVDDNGTIYGPGTDTITPCTPELDEILSALWRRVGLLPEEIDVTQAAGIPVPGFRVATETDATAITQALMPSYFFDVGEWDGKLRAIMRGGSSVVSLTSDDLVERDGDAFERERVQEAELLRRVSVGYIDPVASYGPTTQKWERRSGTVRAMGEASRELPLTLTANQSATIAKRQGLVAWGEPEKGKFSLTIRHAALTPTDVFDYTDDEGEVFDGRFMSIEDDSGVREIEASQNCAEAYTATATGVTPDPPTIGNPGTIGPTTFAAMNLPSLRTADNRPGVYVAACGVLPAWNGCALYLSLDGGVRYTLALDMPLGATMGRLITSIGVSGEPLQVAMLDGGTLSTATVDQIAAGYNTFAIESELAQFQTATPVATGQYDLTTLTRGQRSTDAAIHSASDTFVLINDAVYFLPINEAFAGQTLYFKPVSYGTSLDAAPVYTLVFDPPTYIVDGGEVTP